MDREISRDDNLEKLAAKEVLEKGGVELGLEQEKQSEKLKVDNDKKPEEEGEMVEQPVVPSVKTVSKISDNEISNLGIEEEVEEVEDILEDDLENIYTELDPNTQKTFKEQGEETAKQIVVTIHKLKHHTRKIIKLISSWLKIIPGINKLFVEQEAKIKTDKIEEEISHHHE